MAATRVSFVLLLFACATGCRDAQRHRAPSVERIDEAPAASAAEDRARAEARPSALPAATTSTAASPWTSSEDCDELVARGARLVRPANIARFGTWNVRWFPEGVPGRRPKNARPTDVDWLACTIAWMGVDVLALQEIKGHASALAALDEVTRDLNTKTAGDWRAELDRCSSGPTQHVALLYDASRVKARGFGNVGALNPHDEDCKDHLRPGLGGYFEFPGGFSTHVVSVHFKSGAKRRSLDLRRTSYGRVRQAHDALQAVAADEDVILAGDFNTMGCRRCSPSISSRDEITDMTATLSELPVPYRPVAATLGCSEYYGKKGALLDHFVVTESLRELGSDVRAKVAGYCADLACAVRRGREMPKAYEALSDHCPVLLDVPDRDVP